MKQQSNAAVFAQIRKLSQTMKGITIITAKQLKNDRPANYQDPAFKGPITLDYIGMLK